MNASLDRRKENIEAIATVSPLQQGILFHALRSKEHDPYFYQIVFSLTGTLDVALLERAWQLALDRHQVLRAEYRWEETTTPLQVIFKSRTLELTRLDFQGQSEAEQLERLRALLAEERQQGYDFRHASGLRLRLIALRQGAHWLSWSYHHVSLDGWSMALVLGDAFGFYQKLERGADVASPAPLPYTVYLDWLQKQDQSQALDYWRTLLAGFDSSTPLPRTGSGGSIGYAERALRLEPEASEQLQSSARRLGVTLNTLVQGAWALLLGRHAGTSEVVFGSTVSGRALDLPGIEASAGLFINTLPIRVPLPPRTPIRSWLGELQQQNVDSRRYEHTPLVEIRRAAGISGEDGLFDSVVVFDNYPVDAVLERQPRALAVAPVKLFAEELAASAGRNNYALTLNVVLGERIVLTLAYRSEQFTAERSAQLVQQLGSLLSSMAREPDVRLGNLGLEDAVPTLTVAPAPEPLLLLERFAEQVRDRPRALAVMSEHGRLDFGELDQLSNGVASFLRAEGIGTDDRVGLCAERGTEFVALLLGIWKAGAAYVPFDAQVPAVRLAELARDSGARRLVASERSLGLTRATGQSAGLAVASLAEMQTGAAGSAAPSQRQHPDQAAYVIFTSGSTGRPKGVVVSHGALARYTQGLLARLQLAPEASLGMISTIAADLGHTVLFGALYSGAPLHLIAEARAFDPDAFAEYMAEQRVGVLKIVPSHLRALLHAAQPGRALPAHALIVGGEATDWSLVERLRQLAPGCRIINHYGPTETTVGVCTFELGAERPEAATLPIGRALPHAELHVLDRDLNPLPAGAAGELYIGGARLARGYFASPSSTAERFVPDPWSTSGGRLYRTGDRVRRSLAGDVEFLGRADRQVKIRGYRVELGEIEARLAEHRAVRQAVVVARPSSAGTLQLVGYVVPTEAAAAQRASLPEQLLAHLGESLPDYLLPSQLLVLERLPLTANGKLDAKALPGQEAAPALALSEEAPNAVESHLIDVWQEVLRVEQVRLDDNFFRLGGDSILSLQVIARARRRGVRVTPKQVFEQQTLRALARVASVVSEPEKKAQPGAATSPAAAPREIPLLPLQARFFAQRLAAPQRYTQSVLLSTRQPLEAPALQAALAALVLQHEALQLRYREAEPGRWRQLHPGAASAIAGEELLWRRSASDASALQTVLEEARASLKLERGPLLRAVLLEPAAGGQRLFLVAHHLVVDGVSWRVLLEDLQSAYRQQLGGASALPARSTPPSEWAERLRTYARSEVAQAELPYWLGQLGNAPAGLPERSASGPATSAAASWQHLGFELERDATRRLLSEASEAYRTEVNDLLLTALARALCHVTGQKSVLVQLEGHGREDLFDDVDLSRSVGWLTSIFPVRLRPRLGGAGELGASVKAIKEQLRKVPRRGIGYGLLRHCADEATQSKLALCAEPHITFNYLGQFDQSFDASSLFAPADSGSDSAPSEQGALTGCLGIDAQVYGEQLRVGFQYDSARLAPETVRALADALQTELEALIEHTTTGAHGATPSDFPLIGFSQEQLDALGLLWHDIEDLYPLSPMQEGLLLHTLLEPGSGIYLMQHDHRIEDRVDVAAFRRAWQHVAEQNAVLRTSFVWNEQGMLQAVHRTAQPDVGFLDCRGLTPAQQEQQLAQVLEAELERGFDLGQLPLWRVRLVQTGERSFRFVFSNHHILMDAWSRAQLLQDVFAVYQALVQGAPPPRDPRAPFRDFIAWLEGREAERAAAYFRHALSGFEQATPLPSDRRIERRPGASAVADVALFLSSEQSAHLHQLASQHELTVNTFVQAAWALTLARYSGQRDVLFGVTVAGRPVELPEMEKAIGLFINSIPLRVRLPRPDTLTSDWLRALLAQNLELRQHEHLPLVTIQAGTDLPRGQALFHSLFVFENAPVDVELIESAERMSATALGGRTHTNYPLTVVVYPGSRLGLHLSYDRRFFDETGAQRLLGEFERLLLELGRGFHGPLGALRIVPEGELSRLLGSWNDTEHAYPFEGGFVPLFEERVRRHPDRIAASCLSECSSFASLNARANQIAQVLRRCDVRPDAPVALLAQRGLDLLGGILGTWKSGAAYLPLDPSHPPDRLREILRLAAPRVLLSQSSLADLLAVALEGLPPEQRPEVVLLDGAEVRSARTHNPAQRGHARSLAYVIFTSGSTGVPKGAMVEHAGMLNNQLSKLPWLELSERDVIAQTASQCFDISVWQLLTALLCGARTEIVPDELAHDPGALLRHVRRCGVSVLESVPSLVQALLEHDDQPLPSLRWLLSTGEALPPALARRWLERHGGIPIGNAYGPAECSDDVSLCRIDAPLPEEIGFAPIGTPTDNNRLHVLDPSLELLPVGVIGELCIAGTGVGRGYLGDPRRTAEVFLPHPFPRTPGERLYRSGDLARYRADGVLECVGRRDHQVKLRGYRVELGEIEARLRQHPAVSEAVVLVRAVRQRDSAELGSAQRLVGYVSVRTDLEPRPTAAALAAELNGQLRARLPEYMVPAQLIVLDTLPLTRNGKIDRSALPQPEWGDRPGHVAPRSELGRKLAEVWQRVLGVPLIGENDNFFERGGDSLLATQVISRIRRELQLAVPLRALFETQSLAELERAVQRDGRQLETNHAWGG